MHKVIFIFVSKQSELNDKVNDMLQFFVWYVSISAQIL